MGTLNRAWALFRVEAMTDKELKNSDGITALKSSNNSNSNNGNNSDNCSNSNNNYGINRDNCSSTSNWSIFRSVCLEKEWRRRHAKEGAERER